VIYKQIDFVQYNKVFEFTSQFFYRRQMLVLQYANASTT